jgi:autotransporter-associated beta strand protein
MDAGGTGGNTISLMPNLGTINASQLPDITEGVTIQGAAGDSLSGVGVSRIFWVNAPGQTVNIQSLTLESGYVRGGNGGTGGGAGGGGAGLGGAVFVDAGTVNFNAVSFIGNSAIGGNGGNATVGGGGGGGGLAFAGGSGEESISGGYGTYLVGSGGGGGARSSAGSAGTTGAGGTGGGVHGAGASSAAVGADGGGGGATIDTSSYTGLTGPAGGAGSDFGGGGGGGGSISNGASAGGAGGFGAGGGGGADAAYGYAGDGGPGGFGGGGGGGGGTPNAADYGLTSPGNPGFAGGVGGYGNQGAGGGGGGLGGAVFVRPSAVVSFTDCSTDAGTVTGGTGGVSALGTFHDGSNGTAAGGAFFLTGGTTVFAVSAGDTSTIAGSIAESTPSTLAIDGPGTLVLSANNGPTDGFSGGVVINGGELSISADNNLGAASGGITLDGGSLQVTGTSDTSTARTITMTSTGGGFDIASPGNTFKVGQVMAGTGSLTKSGGGTLLLVGANTYTGTTTVAAGTLQLGYPSAPGSASIAAGGSIVVDSGATLLLGIAVVNNAIGNGGGAPDVAIAPITLSGGTLTTFTGTTHNLGYLNLTGATIAGTASPLAGYYDFTFNSPVTVNAATANSTISAPGGVGLRINIPFNVSSGTGQLLVPAGLHDEPGGYTGGVTTTGSGTTVLTGTNTYSGGTTVDAGTLVIGSQSSFPAMTVLTVNGGTIRFTDLSAGKRFVTTVSSPSINASAGTIDLTNTDLDIRSGSLASLTAAVASGLNLPGGGNWQGSAGITSSTASADTSHLTAVGLIQNNQDGAAVYSSSTKPFDGTIPQAGDILAKYTYFGDANLDGKVDGSDYSLIDAGYASHGQLTGWLNGDFNYDGVIDGSDYALIDNDFNNQGAALSSSAQTAGIVAASAAVPEPGHLFLAAGLAMALGRTGLRSARRSTRFKPNREPAGGAT